MECPTGLVKQLVRRNMVNYSLGFGDIIKIRDNGRRAAVHLVMFPETSPTAVELLTTISFINSNLSEANGNAQLDLLRQIQKLVSSEVLNKQVYLHQQCLEFSGLD
ncbi:hypothetical protein MLD38_025466 [Melastoma candidum]|uniref:Uncharacterized protein n=1 Tax=Melastoma candidum TaxID=119954 RepID=A0ACB9NYK7_9MYRT|nr:hypothetical protein MLD38_025466 [Melastoma candidum]